LGLRVLELACAQLQAWAAQAPELTVAVNVSARQLVEADFVEDVRRVLWSARVDPSRVVLELTESLLVEDSEAAVGVLWQLRGLGVRWRWTTSAPLLEPRPARRPAAGRDEDRQVVRGPARSGAARQRDLSPQAVAMGHGLGLEVRRRGVETAAQAAFLATSGATAPGLPAGQAAARR
jgi:EAL domain-containing protein (putative c-di-GMP-specific phosphodiesterase class I)